MSSGRSERSYCRGCRRRSGRSWRTGSSNSGQMSHCAWCRSSRRSSGIGTGRKRLGHLKPAMRRLHRRTRRCRGCRCCGMHVRPNVRGCCSGQCGRRRTTCDFSRRRSRIRHLGESSHAGGGLGGWCDGWLSGDAKPVEGLHLAVALGGGEVGLSWSLAWLGP